MKKENKIAEKKKMTESKNKEEIINEIFLTSS